VIAHRGASGERPENTLSAYALAVEQRADMIEIDVHESRDGALVVAHDARLSGLEAYGEIGAAPLSAIRGLDAGGGEGIPTLPEVLDRFGAVIPFNVELKWGSEGAYPELESRVLAEVTARGLLERTLFSCFRDGCLARLRERSAAARIALLISPRSRVAWAARARALGAVALHPEASLVDAELVAAAHGEGLAVHPYTVDDRDAMARMIDLGVDGLFTNFPARMRALLASGAAGRGLVA
jgi:glycerophosphoryl diester phosphodiesterase